MEYPNLDVVVQDMGSVVHGVEGGLARDLIDTGRVKFQAHDLFATQPQVEGDVFFFRWILHNWADEHCVTILRAQIPALRPGARVLVMETCMPDLGDEESVGVLGRVPLWVERDLRFVLSLFCFFGVE